MRRKNRNKARRRLPKVQGQINAASPGNTFRSRRPIVNKRFFQMGPAAADNRKQDLGDSGEKVEGNVDRTEKAVFVEKKVAESILYNIVWT